MWLFYLPFFVKGNFFLRQKKSETPLFFCYPGRSLLLCMRCTTPAVNNPSCPWHFTLTNNISSPDRTFEALAASSRHITAAHCCFSWGIEVRTVGNLALPPPSAFPSPFTYSERGFSLSFLLQICCDRQMKPDTEHSDWSDEENIFFFALCSIFGTKLCSFWIMNRSLCSPQKERISKLEIWHLVELNLRWCLDLDDKPKCGTPW